MLVLLGGEPPPLVVIAAREAETRHFKQEVMITWRCN